MPRLSSALAVGFSFNVTLAFVFVTLGYAATFLMMRLWGYPYDQDTRTSEAPRWALWTHRGLGYAFVLCYVVMMWRMVPRLTSYQVELPARTVAHLLLGFTIGFLLLIKISILRFFRHLEEWMPYLGVGILLCTTLLLVLSLPAALREHSLAHGAPGGDPFGPQSRERVARLLVDAELPAGSDLTNLASESELKAGRTVLLEQCTTCHDLKTVLDKPRPPASWTDVVERMAQKPSLFGVMSDIDQVRVIAYLIAITPDLQRSAKQKREHAIANDAEPEPAVPTPDVVRDAGVDLDAGHIVDAGVPDHAGVAPAPPAADVPAIDPARAKSVFLRKCSGCHEIADIDASPPKTTAAVRRLVSRMIGNGLKATKHDLELIRWWLDAHYVTGAR